MSWRSTVLFLTDFADQAVILPVLAVVAIVLLLQGWPRGAAVWLASVGGTFAVMLVLKLVCLACGTATGPFALRSPSGHVAAATVVMGGLMTLGWPRSRLGLPIALGTGAVIGLTRLWLRMHSPLEVVVGLLVGLAGAVVLAEAAAPVPHIRFRTLLAPALVVALLFHGLHLPAEPVIRDTAARAIALFTACRAPTPLAAELKRL